MTKYLVRSLFAAVVATATVAPVVAAADKPADKQAEVGVKIVRDLPYAQDDERQKLDVYLPEGKKDFPVVLFLHGGGFSKGDRKDAAKFGEALAKHGVGVAAAGYRLFPAAKHPQQVQDAAKALAFVHKHVAAHGGRADALFAAGHSAGGHLATLLATDEQYLKAEGLDGKAVRGVIALSGAYWVPEQRADVFGDAAARKLASPASHVRSGPPPFLLAFADKDSPGKDKQTREFADALKAAQVWVEVIEAKDRDHGSLFTRIGGGDADPTGEAVVAFVRKLSEKK